MAADADAGEGDVGGWDAKLGTVSIGSCII